MWMFVKSITYVFFSLIQNKHPKIDSWTLKAPKDNFFSRNIKTQDFAKDEDISPEILLNHPEYSEFAQLKNHEWL